MWLALAVALVACATEDDVPVPVATDPNDGDGVERYEDDGLIYSLRELPSRFDPEALGDCYIDWGEYPPDRVPLIEVPQPDQPVVRFERDDGLEAAPGRHERTTRYDVSTYRAITEGAASTVTVSDVDAHRIEHALELGAQVYIGATEPAEARTAQLVAMLGDEVAFIGDCSYDLTTVPFVEYAQSRDLTPAELLDAILTGEMAFDELADWYVGDPVAVAQHGRTEAHARATKVTRAQLASLMAGVIDADIADGRVAQWGVSKRRSPKSPSPGTM